MIAQGGAGLVEVHEGPNLVDRSFILEVPCGDRKMSFFSCCLEMPCDDGCRPSDSRLKIACLMI